MKRLLFLYISISSGHQRAAEAVMSALGQMNPRVSSHGLDSFSYAFPIVGRVVARVYLEILEHTPQLWSYLYDNPTVEQATREVRALLNSFNAGKIAKLMKRYRPRAIVCTQAFPAALVTALKGRGKMRVPLVGVVTDFGVHSYWLSSHMDLYLVGTEEIKREMVRRGIKESRIRVTGIPVEPHFSTRGNKLLERQRLGLDLHAPTVLVMGGSKGMGPMEDVVETLRDLPLGVQVLAVCGMNRPLLKKMQKRFRDDPAVRVFGFTRSVPRLMDAADVLISKPGGMTCAESLAKGLPMIMASPLPGQEERNVRYLLRHGAAESVDSLKDLGHTVHRLFTTRDALRRLQERAAALGRPYAAYEAAESLLRLIGEPVTHRPGAGERHDGQWDPRDPSAAHRH